MANPWGKFFWNDWETDPALRLCSLAAQGLWMRCLCIAAKADPIGYVIVNGRPLTADSLARLTGAEKSEVETLLSELDQNGVFSRDRKERIYSRRMIRDHKKMKTAQKNGKNGGNPTLCNNYDKSPSDKRVVKGGDKPQKPEARSQKEGPPMGSPKSKRRSTRIPDDWSLSSKDTDYARKKGMNDATIETESTSFRDYYLAADGKGATSGDWPAKWRTWCNNWSKWNGTSANHRASRAEQNASEAEKFKRIIGEQFGSSGPGEDSAEIIDLCAGDGYVREA